MKKLLCAVLCVCLCLSAITAYPAADARAATMAGSGTASDPYIITTAAQLSAINSTGLGKCYKLGNDIDLAYYGTWNQIGTKVAPFTGTFDGGGHSISNLNQKNCDYSALFGYTAGANLKNLHVTCISGSTLIYSSYIAALIAYASSTTVQNCSSSIGSNYAIFGKSFVGGLIGYAENCTINQCGSSAAVEAEGNYIGGLIGYISGSKISNCYSTGSCSLFVSPYYPEYVGGLIGYSASSTIEYSYSGAGISYAMDCGSFIGKASGGSIMCCYSTGYVLARQLEGGGFAGIISDSCQVKNCYTTSNVYGNQANSFLGGFCGWVDESSDVSVCYSSGSVKSDYDSAYRYSFSMRDSAYCYYNSSSGTVDNTSNTTADITYNTGVSLSEMETANFAGELNAHAGSKVWGYSASIQNGLPVLIGVGVGVNIDTTPPTGAYTLLKSAWTCGNVTIYVTATDGGSGVASITKPDGTSVSGASAAYTVTANGTYGFTLTDNSGNSCAYYVTVSNIDRTVSVTHVLTASYTIDPNTGTFSADDIRLTNNSRHIGIAVTLETFKSSGITDISPDKYSNWNALTADETASQIAIGVQPTGTWAEIDAVSPVYAANLTSPVQLGILYTGATGNLTLNAKFGIAWRKQTNVTQSMTLLFSAHDVN